MASPFGERLQRARELVGNLSARELAALAGQTQSLVAQIERGKIESPRSDTIVSLSTVLGVTTDWLLKGEGDEPTAELVLAAVEKARADRAA